MPILDSIKNTLHNLDEREFYIYSGIGFGLLLLLLGILIYFQQSSLNGWVSKFKQLQKQREEIRQLLGDKLQFEQERKALNDKLQAEPDFKIRGYYDELIKQLHLDSYVAKEPSEPISESLEGGAKERTLTAQFTHVTTKQLTEILSAIENNPRVFAKRLIIDKIAQDRPTLNVTLDIATIEFSNE